MGCTVQPMHDTHNPQIPTPLKVPLARRVPRLSGWMLITLLLLVAVWALAPQQLPLSLYKLSLVTLAAVVGYWLDRSLFPYARPDALMDSDMLGDTDPVRFDMADGAFLEVPAEHGDVEQSLVFGLAMLRRAVIVGCAMLAMGLGA